MTTLGWAEGDTCGRDGCDGCIEMKSADGCSCHLSAPCSACTAPRCYCDTCSWQEEDEPEQAIIPGAVYLFADGGCWYAPETRTLDPTKIDWFNKSHSSCSMIKEGVYPPGTTREEVRALVDGTFGGRFEYFDHSKFRFIAYTD